MIDMDPATQEENPVEHKTQDPKYIIIDGMICNAVTREPIPEDEPIFIVRGKDRHAFSVICHYEFMCEDKEHKAAVRKRADEFLHFYTVNRDRMGEPDTAGADDWPDSTKVGGTD